MGSRVQRVHVVSTQPAFPEFRRERKCEGVKVCVQEGEGSSFLFINPRGNAPHPTKHSHLAPEKGVALGGERRRDVRGEPLRLRVDGCGRRWGPQPVPCSLRAWWRGGWATALSPWGRGPGTSWKPLSAVSTCGPQEPSPRALRPDLSDVCGLLYISEREGPGRGGEKACSPSSRAGAPK